MARKTSSIELFSQFKQALLSGKRHPIYYITGDEVFFHDQIIELFISLIPEGMRDFNLDVLYGQDVSLEKILSFCKSYPMMTEFRVVIVREFLNIVKSKSSSVPESSDLNDLIPYLAHPSPTTILVLIDKKAPMKTTKVGKAIFKSSTVQAVQFDPVPEFQLSDWIIKWAHLNHNAFFDVEAAQLLAQYTGQDLLHVSNEIDKLCTFKKTDRTISVQDIREIVGISKEYSIFELKEAIISRNRPQALFVAEQLLHQADSEAGEVIKSIGFFTSTYSQIWRYLKLQSKGLNGRAIQDELGIANSFRFSMIQKEAKHYKTHHIPIIFEALLDADKAIKGFSKLDARSIFLFTVNKMVTV